MFALNASEVRVQYCGQSPQHLYKHVNMKMKSDPCYHSWYLHTVHASPWLVWLCSIMQVLHGGNSLGWNCFRGDCGPDVSHQGWRICKDSNVAFCKVGVSSHAWALPNKHLNGNKQKQKSQHNKNSGTKLSGCESFECQHPFRSLSLWTVKPYRPKFPLSSRML